MPNPKDTTSGKSLRLGRAPTEAPVASRRLNEPAVPRRYVHVTVGIDLGTSSTKVCFRRSDETRPTPYVCVFPHNATGYPHVVLPSTVRVVKGRVYFAAEAECLSDGVAFRSFKTCIRCKLVNRGCIHCESETHGRCPGYRRLPDGEGLVSAVELATWYLAHIIVLTQKAVRSQPSHDGELSYNLAAPMDVIQHEQGRESYTRALLIAEQLAQSGLAKQGVDLQSLRSRYMWLDSECEEIPPEADRKVFVVDENCAALVAFCNSRTAQSGRYALVDIGAGTSDMSIFTYDSRARHQCFYSADVCPWGADHVDQLVLRSAIEARIEGRSPMWLEGDLREVLARIRLAKQGYQAAAKAAIPAVAFKAPTEVVGSELFKHYKCVWCNAYDKEKVVERWQGMKMFVIGGGSNLPGIAEALATTPWPGFVSPPTVGTLQLPRGIKCTESSLGENVILQHERLLMVAFGLSFPFADLAQSTPPSEVIPGQRPNAPPAPIEDIEKFGHWW